MIWGDDARKENMNSATVCRSSTKIKHKTEGDEGFICVCIVCVLFFSSLITYQLRLILIGHLES
jgi:hypothetical protein